MNQIYVGSFMSPLLLNYSMHYLYKKDPQLHVLHVVYILENHFVVSDIKMEMCQIQLGLGTWPNKSITVVEKYFQ